jgi:hypothetical protein
MKEKKWIKTLPKKEIKIMKGNHTSKEELNFYSRIKTILDRDVIRCQTLNFYNREMRFSKKIKEKFFKSKITKFRQKSLIYF